MRAKDFIWGAAAFGFLFTYLAYFPGLMAPDSNDQFEQAQAGYFRDWHPPIMAWLWSLTNAVIPGPGGLFFIMTGLYWAGFGLVSLHFANIGSRKYVIASLLPFLPFLINFAGTIWKDVLVFGCFLTFTGLAMLRLSGRRVHWLMTVCAWMLLIVGCLARHNSVLAAVPLAALYIWPALSADRPLSRLARRLAISTGLVAILVLATGQALDRFVFRAEKTGVLNSLLLWDIVGISHQTGRNLVPGDWSESEAHDLATRCYSPQEWNNLAVPDPNDCSFVARTLKESGLWRRGLLRPWIETVASHPGAYVLVRLSYAHTLLWPNNIFVFEPEAGSFKYGFNNNILFVSIKDSLLFCKTTPIIQLIFTVAFWMGVIVILLLVEIMLVLRNAPGLYPAILVSLSGIFYIWPLLLIGVAGDLRYAYWSIAATFISALLLSTNVHRGHLRNARENLSQRPARRGA